MCAVVQCSKHGAYLCMFVIPLGTGTDCPQLIAYLMGFYTHTHMASCRVHAPIHVLVDGGDVRRGREGGREGGREEKGGSEPLSKEPRTFSTVFGTGMKLVS